MSFQNTMGNMKLKGKLITSMLLAGILPLFIASLVINNMATSALEKQAFNQLESLRAAKKAQVEHYFNQIKDQVITFSESAMITDATKLFRTAFHRLPDELGVTTSDLEQMNEKNRGYYQGSFGVEFSNQNSGEQANVNSLLPTDASTIAAQYQYISNNSEPLGSKDNLDKAKDNTSYSSIHNRYHPIIRDYLRKFGYYDIFIVDPITGHIVYSVFKELDYATSLSTGPYSNTNFSEVFNQAMNSGDKNSVHLVDFKPYLPSYNGAASFISSPIYDGESLIGVLVFQMPVGRINEIMQLHEGMGESGETYLVGPDMLMRSQSRFSEDNTLLSTKVDTEGANAAITGTIGSKIFADYRGVNVLSAFAPVELVGLKWGILAEIDEAEAFSAIASLQWAVFGLGVVATILIALFAVFYAKNLSHRVTAAKDIAANISTGNFDNQVVVNNHDEVGELMGALEVMQTELIGSLNKEKDTANKLLSDMHGERTAIDQMMARIEFDMDGNIKTANDAFLNAMGYQLEEIQEKHHRIFVDNNYATSNEYKLFWEKLNRGETAQGEFMRINKSGDEVWIDAIYSPILDDNGKPTRVIKFAREITEQKNAQLQIQGLIEGALKGKLDSRMQDVDQYDGFMRTLGEGINDLLNAFSQPVSEVMRVIKSLAEGDLTQKMEGDFKGEFAIMQDSINEANVNLLELISKIQSASGTINTSATEIVQGNTDLSSRTEQQASALEETASTVEEMTGTVKQNADNAKQANQLAKSARETAEKGGSVVSNAINAMSEINTSSNKIADIISVIDEIAFQTNLLALNAAVEAARAGEQGRGFAVVASEVRNLAQRSAEAAREIKGLIEDSVNKVEEGSKLVDESGNTLEEIVLSVKKVSDIIAEIAAAGEEQYVGIEQINKAVSEMDQMTQQNAALVEEAAAASQAMNQQSHDLSDAVKVFNVNDHFELDEDDDEDDEVIERRSADRPWSEPAPVENTIAEPAPMQAAAAGGADDEWEEF